MDFGLVLKILSPWHIILKWISMHFSNRRKHRLYYFPKWKIVRLLGQLQDVWAARLQTAKCLSVCSMTMVMTPAAAAHFQNQGLSLLPMCLLDLEFPSGCIASQLRPTLPDGEIREPWPHRNGAVPLENWFHTYTRGISFKSLFSSFWCINDELICNICYSVGPSHFFQGPVGLTRWFCRVGIGAFWASLVT